MRKVSPLICKKYKSPVFHNTEDLNQLKSYKDYTLKGFVCKGNELFSNCQINPNKKSLLTSRLKRNPRIFLFTDAMEETYCKGTKKYQDNQIYI